MQYTETIRKVSETKVVREFTAPKHWACFTSATNTSLRKKAETCIKKIEAANMNRAKVKQAVFLFEKGWVTMCDSSRHQAAGVSDTEVRESVREFASKALNASGLFSDPDMVEREIYDDVNSLPKEAVTHKSNKGN